MNILILTVLLFHFLNCLISFLWTDFDYLRHFWLLNWNEIIKHYINKVPHLNETFSANQKSLCRVLLGTKESDFCCFRNQLKVITVSNEVAKVMFLHVSVILFTGGGVVSQNALQVVSQHALQQGGVLSQNALQWGVPALGECLLPGGLLPGGSAPGGCLLPGVRSGGVCSQGWGACSQGGCGDPPGSRWLLLRMVRILLECILVILSS